MLIMTVSGQRSNEFGIGFLGPALLSLSPSVGNSSGGALVTLVGTNFGPWRPIVTFSLPETTSSRGYTLAARVVRGCVACFASVAPGVVCSMAYVSCAAAHGVFRARCVSCVALQSLRAPWCGGVRRWVSTTLL